MSPKIVEYLKLKDKILMLEKSTTKNYPLDLTIAISVKNEERNLPGCLNAIGNDFVQHIVVIDSGSTDKTIEIAKSFGADVINFKWNGKFPKKRNWFLRNYFIKTSWILFLDADEYITSNFKLELANALLKDEYMGFWLNYTIHFLGKRLKGGYPLRKLALFKPEAGEYETIEEDQWSQLDMEVHEHPIIQGKVGVIKSKIDHQDFRGVSNYIIKHNEYASWEAKRFLKMSTHSSIYYKRTWKQHIKYGLIKSVWIAPIYFLGSFLMFGGFRDGPRGFAFAVLKMSYFIQVYCKIKEQNT